MVKDELIALNSKYEKDIEMYREILTETLKNHLLNTIQMFEEDILDCMKDIAADGRKTFEIRLIPSHIYKHPFTRSFFDMSEISLDYCIKDYIYIKRIMGLYSKQVKFTHINFKSFYKDIEDRVLVNEIARVNDIMDDNPSIENNMSRYFNNLGLTFQRKWHPYFYSMELSF